MNKEIIFYKGLKNIISNNILNISQKEIDEMYDSWENDKNKSEIKRNFVKSDDFIHKNQNVPENVTLKGIDFPTWFGDYSNKRIVILGIDPLRSESVFERENNANIQSDVIIGTPYAFHEKETREDGCKSYWTFVNGLVESNNFVYCTDIFKTYFHDKTTRSYDNLEFTKNKKHREILIAELELIKPDLIIVFGGIAHKKLLNKKSCPTISQSVLKTKSSIQVNDLNIPVYTVIHLSRVPRGKDMKKFLNANDIDTNSVDVENRVECAKKYIELFNEKILK
jgi:hypothetical protein